MIEIGSSGGKNKEKLYFIEIFFLITIL